MKKIDGNQLREIIFEHKWISLYVVIWFISLVAFWFGAASNGNEMGFAIFVFYLALPISSFLISLIYGIQTDGRRKWLLLPFFGIMAYCLDFLTFELANIIKNGTFSLTSVGIMAVGLIPSFFGMFDGVLTRKWQDQRLSK